jgi:hypothetical protein
MAIRVPRYSMEDFARPGDEIYDRVVRPRLAPPADVNMLVAIDIESGGFAIDRDGYAATERLLAR